MGEKETQDAAYRSQRRLKASAVTAKAAEKMAKAATEMANEMMSKRKFDQDRHLVSMYRDVGDMENARALLKQMAADRDREREEPAQQAQQAQPTLAVQEIDDSSSDESGNE